MENLTAQFPYLQFDSVCTNHELGLRAEVYRDFSYKMADAFYRVILRDTDADKTVAVVWNRRPEAVKLAESFVDMGVL